MSEQQELSLKLELTISEVNTVLGALAQRPYAEVAGLFAKVQQQAQGQLPPPGDEGQAAE